MKENKSIIITIIAIIILISLLIIATLVGEKEEKELSTKRDAETIITNAQNESKEIKETEKRKFIYINVDEYLDLLSNKDTQFILVARPTCQYCKIAEPIIQNIMYEHKIDLYYLNTDDFSEEDQNKFISSNDYFSNGFGTPLLLCTKDGQFVDIINGLMDRHGYVEFFKAYGLINKEE